MAHLTAENCLPLAHRIAHEGIVVITPDFTSSLDAPFPAGLEDCYAAVTWASEHREQLGTTPQRVVSGENGGGNLSIATALLAKVRGLTALKGVHAIGPVIGGPVAEYGDLNGYWIDEKMEDYYRVYTANLVADDAMKYLALPHHATVEQLKGLVTTLISVNELDPIKHEGWAAQHS